MPTWFVLLGACPSRAALISGLLGFSMLLIGVLLLLRTTPVDAIKLPVRRSVSIILFGTAWLHVCAIVLLKDTSLLHIAAAALMLLATGIMIDASVRARRSTWYAAIVAWQPVTVVDASGHLLPISIGVLLVAVAVDVIVWRTRHR